MNRFLLFSFENYYPSGGWEDFAGDYATLDEAKDARFVSRGKSAHIVDTQTGKIVATAYGEDDWEDEGVEDVGKPSTVGPVGVAVPIDSAAMNIDRIAGSLRRVCVHGRVGTCLECGKAPLGEWAIGNDPRVVSGADLDAAAEAQGVFRHPGETDVDLRMRLLACIERDRAMMDPNGAPK